MRWTLCSILIAFICCLSACKRTETPTNPTPTDNIAYTAIGASDGVGFGASVPCLPFDSDCPSGTGYVYLLKRRLQEDGRTVTLRNLSVPGAVLSPAIQTLARDIGHDVGFNQLNQGSSVSSATTHVTIFAGGNDANIIGESVRAGRGGSDVRGFIDQNVSQWGADLSELVRRIRTRAPNARIVALNLPNLAVAPYVASRSLQERSVLQRIAVGLTDHINALSSQNVLIVDLMCDGRVYDLASFFSDGFHPSDRGYAIMAELTYPLLANGAGAAPSSSCGPRSALPVF